MNLSAKSFICALGLLLSTTMPGVVRADFVLSISDGVTFGPSVVEVDAGTTVTINLLATQTGGANLFDSVNTGLVSGDFNVMVAGTQITPTAFSFASTGFVDVGSDPSTIIGQNMRLNFEEATDDLGGVGVTVANDTLGLDPSGDSVVIGTATFNIDLTASGTHLVTIVPNKDGNSDDLFLRADNGAIPAQLEFNDPTTFSFNVTAVPEPSSFGALLIVGGVLTLRRRRR